MVMARLQVCRVSLQPACGLGGSRLARTGLLVEVMPINANVDGELALTSFYISAEREGWE